MKHIIEHYEDGTTTTATVHGNLVLVVNRATQVRRSWPTPRAATLRHLARRAAQAHGRTLSTAHRVSVRRDDPAEVAWTYRLAD